MQVINDAKNCRIVVKCTEVDFSYYDTSTITSVQVKRRIGTNTVLIGVIAIASPDDLNFAFADYFVACGLTSEYFCIPIMDGVSGAGASGSVESRFDGVFIGNMHEQYVCRLDVHCNSTMNFNMNYVQTLQAQYPHAISNGNMRHYSGTFQGTFIEMDKNCNFIIESATAYRRKVEAFLANGEAKVMKTNRGDMRVIQVNGKVSETGTEYQGVYATSFEWTEIAAEFKNGIVVITDD